MLDSKLEGTKEFVIIYRITNKLNNKVYIGQTLNYEERKAQHLRVSKSITIENYDNYYKVYQAIFDEGLDNFIFEPIATTYNIKRLNGNIMNCGDLEKILIKQYDSILNRL